MPNRPEFRVDDEGLAAVDCTVYPAGKALAFSRGDPACAAAAQEALAASVIFVPVFVNRLFVREMEDRGVPLDVAMDYEERTRVIDEVYVRHPEGKAPKSRYRFVGIVWPEDKGS